MSRNAGESEEGVQQDESLEKAISGNYPLLALIIHWQIALSLVLQKCINKHLLKEHHLELTKHALLGGSDCW